MDSGKLLIIGGKEEKCKTGDILNAFVELSKEREGAIGILPTASSIPDEVSAAYVDVFKKLGVGEVEVISVDSREKADDPVILNTVSGLAALFITGGDQKRLSDCIRNTKLHAQLTDMWKSGLLIGGTSAGASIMGEDMIIYSEMKKDF